MKILGIETSCDETAASIVENGTKILSNVVVSQIDIHAAYGGVVPEIAARSHIEAILPVIHKATEGISYDAIAVTHTPGLNGSLLIGTLTARTLALLKNKPLYPTHHLKSHIYANWLETLTPPEFPLLALVISGGHTQLIYMQDHNQFEIIGTTRDDAVGEAFDKAAKILGLPYPGGPSISAAAKLATVASKTNKDFTLPIPKVPALDFSFSGLKTALLRTAQNSAKVPISTPSTSLPHLLTPEQKNALAYHFEQTAIATLRQKLIQAIKKYHPVSIVLGGGVSANQELRKALERTFHHAKLFFPAPKFCGDNATMVASAAHFSIQAGTQPSDPLSLDVSPHTPIH